MYVPYWQDIPDGGTVLVLVEGIEHSFLAHSEMDIGKLLTLGDDPHQFLQSLSSTEPQKTLHALECHTVPRHQSPSV